MKYLISMKINIGHGYGDDNISATGYVKRFKWEDRRLIPAVDWTPYIHEALHYEDHGAANCIKDIVNRRFVGSKVVAIEDKDLFKAKLAYT